MKVYNLEGQSGRAVSNQFVIKDGNRKVFQSYDSTIVEVKWYTDFCEVNIGHDWDLLIKKWNKLKKELRKGCDTITIGRFTVHYCEGM